MNRELNRISKTAFVIAAVISMFMSPIASVARSGDPSRRTASEGEIVAKLNFDPAVNGYGFANYPQKGAPPRRWQDDLGAEDLIRMFGPAAVCKSGTTAKDCVMKASAHQWMFQELKAMSGGHCEGMAVTCLRVSSGLPFKSFTGPTSYQPGVKSVFGLGLEPAANTIAYYFATQDFREVKKPTKETGRRGPLAIVKMLIDSMNNGSDPYILGIYKCDDCEKPDGHAITPFAVEDDGDQYKIHVYDNNFPGKTGYMTVNKGGKQTWKYEAAPNPDYEPELYTGNIDTATLEITAASWRDGKCFEAPFAANNPKATGCGIDTAKPEHPGPTPKPTPTPTAPPIKPPTLEDEPEDAHFFLTGPGDMLVIDGNNKKVGFDPNTGKYQNEIPDADVEFTSGGLGMDAPHYILPFDAKAKPYVVIFSGRGLKKKSVMDFVYCGPGFTVGFDGIKLDPGEIMVAAVSANGQRVAMEMSKDGEMPEIFYAIDTPEKSYSAMVKGTGFTATKGSAPLNLQGAQAIMNAHTDMGGFLAAVEKGKQIPPTMLVNFQDANKLQIEDNIEGDNSYDVDLEQFDAKGKKNKIQLNDVGKGDKGADAYEIEVGEWNGGDKIAVKHDDEGNGFDDDEEVMDADTPNDINDDPDKDGGGVALMSYLYRAIGW